MAGKSKIGLTVAGVLVCAAAVGGVIWYRGRALAPAALLGRLPTADALILAVDFHALRSGGLLETMVGSTGAEDSDYRNFIERTHFDYKRDLDLAVASFAPGGKFLLLVGRFDWKALGQYAAAQGGRCDGEFCRMPGSTPERRISFFPVRRNLMALAVSQDDSAARRLETSGEFAGEGPDAPVWVSIPAAMLRTGQNLPDGTRMFARSVGQADTVTLGFAPDGQRLAARLNVLCRNEMEAADIALQLQRVTKMLRDLIARENQKPNPADLSGVLTAGSFRPDGRRVYGYWPIEPAFVRNVLAGAP